MNELKIGDKSNNLASTRNQEILEKLSLWEVRDCHPASLSRGQKQRLTIAGALKADSRIIFLDEPTSGLDLNNMLRVTSELKTLAADGRTVFVITHDYEFILAACHRILYLDKGGIQRDFLISEKTKDLILPLLLKGGGLNE